MHFNTHPIRYTILLLLLPLCSFHAPQSAALLDVAGDATASYPKGYFIAPVSAPLLVTGTFCELRAGHFHGGLDLKSKTGAAGPSVFAAADGYVEQVKVMPNGYGNVLYVRHPNGYLTLYAHLQGFAADLAAYVKQVQYQRERFEVTIDLPKDKFRVRKGDVIARMGNSGSSTGPHLHFEIRDPGGRTINPALVGLPIPDAYPPDLRDLKLYALTEERGVLYSQALPIEKRKDGSYGLKGGADAASIGAWRVGLGIKAYDRSDALRNDNGVYALRLLVNGQLAFGWTANELDFEETRYLNAHSDYPAQQRFGAWFHRLFVLPGDQLSMYERTATLGAIPLSTTQPAEVQIEVKDASGNTSKLAFTLYRSENMVAPVAGDFQYHFNWNTENRIQTDGFSALLGKGTLYEDLNCQFKTTPDASAGVYSPVYHLHNNDTPVHKPFDISILPENVPANLRDKAVIVRCSGRRPDNCGGTWKDGRLTTKVRSFGDYCVMVDNVPPSISAVVFGPDMRKKKELAFRISDNFDVTDQADRLSWRGEVDGQWILFEYDSKRGRLTHTFDGRIAAGNHTLRLVVKDDRGNEAVFEKPFRR